MESIVTILIWLAMSIVLVLLDLAVGGILTLLTSLTFKKIFLYGLWSLVLPPLLIYYGIFIERNHCTVKNVELTYPTLPKSFDGYRIVQISDIHSQSFMGRLDVLEEFVNEVNNLHPDLILFTGDVITISPDELDSTGQILSGLHARDGVISILGNHDYCMYMGGRAHPSIRKDALEVVKLKERQMGWDLLLDENRFVTRGNDSIAIVGVENITPSKHFPSIGDLRKASEGTEGIFRILLTHDPLHWDSDPDARKFQLTLSGHTHSCQFSIFGLTPSSFTYKHYRGLYNDESSDGDSPRYLYVNPGLGETLFPARIGVVPEITLFTLKTK